MKCSAFGDHLPAYSLHFSRARRLIFIFMIHFFFYPPLPTELFSGHQQCGNGSTSLWTASAQAVLHGFTKIKNLPFLLLAFRHCNRRGKTLSPLQRKEGGRDGERERRKA